MKDDCESTLRGQDGGRGSATGGAGTHRPVSSPGKNFVQNLTVQELTFLLSLIDGHRSYYALLAGNTRCGDGNRGKHERIEELAMKLEKMRGAGVRNGR
jgi:hypothetical protein